MGELGDRLRQAREAKGLTLEQVEEITRIRRRFLQALEEEDYGQLPGEAFVRGFLRNYAVVLGLNPDEVLAASGRKAPMAIASVARPAPRPLLREPLIRASARRWVMTALSVMAIIALGLGGWTFYRYLAPGLAQISTPSPQATATTAQIVVPMTPTPSPTPTVAATPTASPTAEMTPTLEPTAAPISGLQLRIEATGRAWVTIAVDSKPVFAATLEPGQSKEWQAREQIALHCGNAGALRIWINGQEQEPIGSVGQQVDKVWTAESVPLVTNQGTPATEATPGALGTPPSQETSTITPSPAAGEQTASTQVPSGEGTPGPLGTPPGQGTPTVTPTR